MTSLKIKKTSSSKILFCLYISRRPTDPYLFMFHQLNDYPIWYRLLGKIIEKFPPCSSLRVFVDTNYTAVDMVSP